ncbi:hypothetical protein A2962_03180 [Candidatus Woesebacteria bacterium RIFCSPLOWO2_01_FULL_39_61]|uniref:Glycosyltransferase 2-like domain-containing protein n=1 Tax=Candidatus Woesebacteria bacterium RIFCSPHIGHO2_02_FULL_39_13 TaxID=1802505 RepID=A0A1F7Z2F1_9BACT|nr:MAG: hypothetical protein A2692_04265 [Candidatus Woesebacteria bacterium RIFCSPHIGHO2_01_FULL_39_95]OGM33826.1 MAG: hypothetical protein A3D01_02550 [Candidatus Woesebacteria bacterium RIFCSPHIGHO2_02_FULL_39_13]OGM38987.1 MAG: hypothetical protein A3E13_04820 [Candidatus Woesebacteria bacterium RIFCSPHIGHO2_12_FULL_40_20]OGM67492.1 MAG: hypothetical protein A2962_03180 [Candidatus Woesebacteria bacterium RIFCSPLOWO2_01_FULL_39_61]OGM72823.1 MAG: hypothetical protein A3H19_05685 [Candidatus
MKNKITISIGIPTYLAGEHLVSTLRSIYRQTFYSRLKEILLVVDGGYLDPKIVGKIGNKKLKIVPFTKRKGQSTRVNDIFAQVDSDLLILANDDVILDEKVVEKMVRMFIKDRCDLLCTKVEPLAPKTRLEKILKPSHYMKYEILNGLKNKHDSFLVSNGRLLGLSIRLYKGMKLSRQLWNGDAFIYLHAKLLNYKISFVDETLCYFRDPQKLEEYLSQSKKFRNSLSENKNYFKGETFIRKYYEIPKSVLVRAYISTFKKHPIDFILYNILYLCSYICLSFYDPERNVASKRAYWEVDYSTKQI